MGGFLHKWARVDERSAQRDCRLSDRVTITDAAVRAPAVMSDRYVSDRAFPDKAIDLIDERSPACA